MRRIDRGQVGIDRGETILFSDFDTEGEMWVGTGPREARVSVEFAEGFATPPVVHLAPAMWDMAHGTNARADLSPVDVTASGFVIRFRTWEDTRIARFRVSWLAIGPVADDDNWDV